MRIFNNFLYKLSAVLIACVLWAATQGLRPVEKELEIPITLESTPEAVVVVAQSATDINVTVKGSLAAIRRAERQVVRYPISLDGVKPGEARIAVDGALLKSRLPRGAQVEARSPSAVVLRLEERVRKNVRVDADVTGSPADGFRAEVSVNPPTVELEGARTALRGVRNVSTARVDISGVDRSEDRNVSLLIDTPHVWRADEDRPIQVRIEVQPTDPPTPGAE